MGLPALSRENNSPHFKDGQMIELLQLVSHKKRDVTIFSNQGCSHLLP